MIITLRAQGCLFPGCLCDASLSCASRGGQGPVRRLTRSRSNTPHVDDVLGPLLQPQPTSADAADGSASADAKANTEAESEAQRAAFLAATEGFGFEDTIVVVRAPDLSTCLSTILANMLWTCLPKLLHMRICSTSAEFRFE